MGFKTNGIPLYLKQFTKLYWEVLEYLSIYIEPPTLNPQAPSTSVYSSFADAWNESVFLIRVSEIKWLLMNGKEQLAIIFVDKLLDDIRRRCDDYHPVEADIRNILSHYYFEKGDLQKSQEHGLQSLEVLETLVPQTHSKRL